MTKRKTNNIRCGVAAHIRRDQIMALILETRDGVPARKICVALSLSMSQVCYYLRSLRDLGLLASIGTGVGATWQTSARTSEIIVERAERRKAREEYVLGWRQQKKENQEKAKRENDELEAFERPFVKIITPCGQWRAEIPRINSVWALGAA